MPGQNIPLIDVVSGHTIVDSMLVYIPALGSRFGGFGGLCFY